MMPRPWFVALPPEPPANGIGTTTTFQGQQFMSVLPNNTFAPATFGWEAYGDEP